MPRHWIAAALAVGLLAVGLLWTYWRQAKLQANLNAESQTIAALQSQLNDARQELITQREQLRHRTLTETTRTPDEFLALFPARFPLGNWQPSETRFEDCWFRTVDSLRLHGWLLARSDARQAILLVHGNAGNLTNRSALAQILSDRCDASVLVFDYRGYGRSEGVPTIPGLVLDARAARAHLANRQQIPEENIILFGESLGGAIAVDLAAEDGARALVLESTFSSLKDAAAVHYPAILVDALVANRLDSTAKIKRYRGPLVQVHGEADATIPIALGRKLFDAAGEPKTFIAIPGRDHNDPLPASFFESLSTLFDSLPK